MNRRGSLSAIHALLWLALLIIPQGCSSSNSDVPTVYPTPAPDTPRPLTDLSKLSTANSLAPFGKREQAIARQVTSEADTGPVDTVHAVGSVRHIGDEKHPGEVRLLNKKAAQFDALSMRVLDQIFVEASSLEQRDEISHFKLPLDLKPVIITGTLNRDGVLKELVVEQHSGTAAIDRMMVDACKKGMYLRNPPPDARDAAGNYKLRIEARMENFASMDGEHWQFKTYLGLAIL
jgi:hypothetical protein